MEPTAAPSSPNWTAPVSALPRSLVARAWAALSLLPQPGRQRWLSISRGRLTLLVLMLAGLAGAAEQLWRWQDAQDIASHAAAAGARLADQRLDHIGAEMADVDIHLGDAHIHEGCDPNTVLHLVRATVASTLVQQYVLVDAQALVACGPEGATEVPRESLSASQRLALAGNADRSEASALRRRAGGDILIAMLDPRAFDVPADAALGTGRVALTIRDSDDKPLATVGRPHASADSTEAGPLRTTVSQAHGLRVRATVPPPRLDHRTAVAVILALLMFALGFSVWLQRRLGRIRDTARLAAALRKREFIPYVQPILDTATGRCVGGEVLMRWQHPHRGVLAPGEFIEAAERSGLIEPMSELVMASAALQLAPLARIDPGLSFSFNVTAGQLRRPGFADGLGQWFNSDSLPSSQVVLELTERDAVDPLAARALQAVHKAGWRIAIDDFGTGHSSLAVLESLPIDRIKIDRAFVRTIDEQTVRRPVLDAIIQLSAQLRMPLVAEGVETESQRAYLAERGVQWIQGFLMARPMSVAAFARWLGQRCNGQPIPLDMLSIQDAALLDRMTQPGGVPIRDRRWNLAMYERSFIGRQCIHWLQREAGLSRQQAVQLGRRWVAAGRVAHVRDEHDFEDADLFYRIVHPAKSSDDVDASQLDALIKALGDGQGPPVDTHARGLLLHRQTVTGQAVLDWITASSGAARPVALELGRALMRAGRLRHVYDDRPMQDGRALYRLH